MTSPPAREHPAWTQALGEALAESLPRLLEERADPLVKEVILALTLALCRGEVQLDLGAPPPEGIGTGSWPEDHRRAVAASALSREPDGPLVLAGDRLAWRRWMQRQSAVVDALIERAGAADPLMAEGVDAPETGDPLQWHAVQAVLNHRLVLLLGGPGTGKTSTVARMLAAVRQPWPEARIHLAAPTGKAAARLRVASGGRAPCSTLHRLLERRGGGFARGRHQPLALDLLVIEEVSMVDLALMEAVLEALPATCRLVLVGDPAQLPPIAPGPVLEALQQPEAMRALEAVRIELRTTYRNAGAIAVVAERLRASLVPAAAAAS
ncbi:MAG: AAA family ATPase, partial [Cyanobium sp.]